MLNSNDRVQEVRQRYAAVAKEKDAGAGCCSPGCCAGPSPVGQGMTMRESYAGKAGYVEEADLALGCGLPTAHAALRPGETVLDLGSGAGNDVFVAAEEVGPTGQVIGVDMTPEMIELARSLAKKQGLGHVAFRLGEIEALPVESGTMDAVISNCVLNLVEDKNRAFSEMFRVLKPGGRFSVSDIVFEGQMPDALKPIAELYVGCVSGAMAKDAYSASLRAAGFTEVRIVEEKPWDLPAEIVQPHLGEGLDAAELLGGLRILKVTVTGVKPRA